MPSTKSVGGGGGGGGYYSQEVGCGVGGDFGYIGKFRAEAMGRGCLLANKNIIIGGNADTSYSRGIHYITIM